MKLSVIVSWFLLLLCVLPAVAQNTSHNPTWWNKYQYLLNHPADNPAGPNSSLSVGANVDVSNECGPQSETFIAINPGNPKVVAAGSNEIFRDPMRGYFSTNNGSSWGGVDLPLPAPIGNGTRFGSDPSLAFDTRGNVFYGYIVVFFGNGLGVNGTEMAVAKSTDGGKSYPAVTLFDFAGGSDHFNDKPIVAADTNTGSPFRDNVYIAWDTSGGSTSGGVRVATSTDHGATFNSVRIDAPSGQANSIGASPFVGPDGTVFVAWNDFRANVIAFARSADGGATWERPNIVSTKTAVFDLGIPAEEFRRALVYPSCDSDRSAGPHRGRIYCSWMDLTPAGVTDIFLSFSDDKGNSWSPAAPVTDQLVFPVDRFNQWMAVDPVTGDVNVSFYDTRNDSTGFRFMTDTFFAQSKDGGQSFLSPNVRVSTASSNEHDCNGLFPCNAIDYFNQQGDYEGLASFGGVSHPIWTDSRLQQSPLPGCSRGLAMEEVFTAVVK
jgi:hypothetical protein